MTGQWDGAHIHDFNRLESDRAFTLINRTGVWVLIAGDVLKAIFRYPTEDQVLSREGGNASGKTLRILMRVPELFIHVGSGVYPAGSSVRILCRPDSPDFVMGDKYYTEGAMYRVSLNHAQEKPVDTKGRGWA